jgi:hypothetical protein
LNKSPSASERKFCPKGSSEAQPYISRVTSFDQSDIADSCIALVRRFVGRFAALDAVADGFVEMAANLGVEFVVFALSPAELVKFHASRSCSIEAR